MSSGLRGSCILWSWMDARAAGFRIVNLLCWEMTKSLPTPWLQSCLHQFQLFGETNHGVPSCTHAPGFTNHIKKVKLVGPVVVKPEPLSVLDFPSAAHKNRRMIRDLRQKKIRTGMMKCCGPMLVPQSAINFSEKLAPTLIPHTCCTK